MVGAADPESREKGSGAAGILEMVIEAKNLIIFGFEHRNGRRYGGSFFCPGGLPQQPQHLGGLRVRGRAGLLAGHQEFRRDAHFFGRFFYVLK